MAAKLFCSVKPRTPYFLSQHRPPLSLSLRPKNRSVSLSRPLSSSSPTIKMAAKPITEHIVLFNVRPETDPSKIKSMVDNLNGLKTLDQVLHITAGVLTRTRSSPFPFTHVLHSRYESVEDLNAYSDHPRHVSVVREFVLPICDDIMAVDWVAKELTGPVQIQPGSGMRVNLLKLKENLGKSEKDEILRVIGGIKDKFPAIEQIIFGENFSPGRARGFSIGSLAVMPGLGELEALDSVSNSEIVNSEKEKVRGLIESVIVLDYLVPQVQNASL